MLIATLIPINFRLVMLKNAKAAKVKAVELKVMTLIFFKDRLNLESTLATYRLKLLLFNCLKLICKPVIWKGNRKRFRLKNSKIQKKS